MNQVIKEQVYHDQQGNVSQIRCEISNNSVEWLRPNGSTWDGPLHDASSRQITPETIGEPAVDWTEIKSIHPSECSTY